MKFGVQIPGTVEEALHFDKEAGNGIWKQAIRKEWKNSRVAFKILDCGEGPPVGYKEITFHLRLCPNKKIQTQSTDTNRL